MSDLLELLDKYKNDKIAIYGLGVESEKALSQIGSEFKILGLLDGYKSEGTLYGYPIISMDTAIQERVKVILVVARPGSCRAIAKRIGKICTENEIELMDIRGNNLCSVKKENYDFKSFVGYTKKELSEKIKSVEIISFDLFDTLLMRQTLFPFDVPELVNEKLRNQGIEITDFSAKRLLCEKELSKQKAPSLIEIYTYMKECYNLQELNPFEIAELEWQIDYELVVPREEVVHLFHDIVKLGKKIFIISDSYYSKEQLMKLCDKCAITGYKDILDSCEYGLGKTQGLFKIYCNMTKAKSYLHIGDDLIADIENAQQCGLEAYQIYSGLELLEMTGYMGLWDVTESLSDRIKVGMFISKLFNSPFQFDDNQREIRVENAYDLGYLFFAPMITDFVIWFGNHIQQMGIETILFGARDGYLIKELYDKIYESKNSIYFLTSRTAAVRAGMENEEDIRYVADMKFSGSIRSQLESRFGLELDIKSDVAEDSILNYSEEIIKHSVVCREKYLKYINTLDLTEDKAIFFDFVAKGTTQLYVNKLISNHLQGLYFLQLEPDYMRNKQLKIETFYGVGDGNQSSIYDNYYILETVLTAPHASIYEFDSNGSPIYAKETRNERDLYCVSQMQKGISEYFEKYLKLCPESKFTVNKQLDEVFLGLVHKIKILDKDFLSMKVEDPFFNRMTDITDVV